ncbi:DEAD/DEAH box helicase [Nostoc sp. FACHB-888]|uniref:DEAD/DEAH box helicase n=1 Tax=Nostoc sp. FACHB-888 TaxID=2692842 RepID=UPI0016847570|nr:DEAD/DEAH box helicase [Nostoc sp. FACHB-888]MBD2247481.1 DEAD/DEAH box helicase [Nostoc sp. FACHB-888]
MAITVKLNELIQQPENAILSISTLLGQKLALLDCSGVVAVTPEQLTLLFTAIPETWQSTEIKEVFDFSTITPTFNHQLQDWINQRLGYIQPQTSITDYELTSTNDLDIFNFRNEVIGDYRRYIESFLKIRDRKVKEFVDAELDKGQLWTDPLVQLNPSYKKGATVKELVQQQTLHPDCEKYFYKKDGTPFIFHYHQKQAFETAQRQEPYVVTTGTGSGKSMTYVVPIFDDLLRHPEISGVRAILVYPMNALINSQKEELDKFLRQVPNTHIRVEKYTGQESLTKKTEIQNNPPHILLTNYVMLELMLSRTHENKLVESPNLKFLVLDELHTYRGRQGADVAILIRKLRQRSKSNEELLCIGTSATMSTVGSRQQRRQVVADVASKLFGVEIKPSNVIDETLERSIQRAEPTIEQLCQGILAGLPTELEQTLTEFRNHSLSYWIEMNFGLEEKEGHLVRRQPISLETGTTKLAEQTQLLEETCLIVLKQMFLWGSKTNGLAFRLHQFISQGGSVYATIENRDKRYFTLEGQYTTTGDRLLYPLVFCRECGHDYYVVRYDADKHIILPQLPTALDISPDDADIAEGYLTLDEPGLWDTSDEDRLPDSWFSETKKKGRVAKKDFARFIPRKLQVLPNGKVTSSLLSGTTCWFISKPFLTCLNCGVLHDKKRNEFVKLSRLSSEGRSTATTLLCLSTTNRLKQVFTGEKAKAAKILSFTDNRQDASLQAGHFNDFVQTSFLRAALLGAIQAKEQLTHTELASVVVQYMGITQNDYAKERSEYGSGKRRNEEAFRKLIEYRLYEDLRRGWRIVQPNLEQCGLLAIEYDGLLEACTDHKLWQKHRHPVLLQASPQERFIVTQALLNQLRRELAIDAKLLQPDQKDSLKSQVIQAIKEPWVFDENEYLYLATWATVNRGTERAKVKLTTQSRIGRFLRSPKTWSFRSEPLTDEEFNSLITTLISALCDAGYLLQQESEVQLRIDSLLWKVSNLKEIPADPLTSRRLQGNDQGSISVNQFFQEFYQNNARQIRTMEGREHTGQVSNKDRQEREDKFRQGQLAALFCSPTMELGIDISDLSVVHLRNVPPSPANYAQRSGRAGRSGQEALVITYASIGSGHDQYFFKRQNQMVAGVVAPPKLELANQDLIKSHVYSIWLAHTGVYLEDSMNKILDLELENYPLKDSIRQQLTLSQAKLTQCLQAAQSIFSDFFCQEDLQKASWYSVNWLQNTIENALNAFDRACKRWRDLYIESVKQLESARRIIDRFARGDVAQEERKNAEAQAREAQRQIDLLVGHSQGKSNSQFEFYPYRYFAAEGFLPGFNFPRLPVRAFIPAGEGGEFISRPRSMALREFAPNNILYYEGSKFMVAKTKVPVGGIEGEYKRVSVCANCGYYHDGDFRDTCENCGTEIKPDAHGNVAKLTRVLPMETAIARRRERITCDEEERLKYGYNITTHFRYASQKRESAIVQAADGTPLFKLTYGATATIWRINRGLKKNREERGFKLNPTTGVWGDHKNPQTQQTPDSLHTEVNLMVDDTCNILIVEPLNVPVEDREAFIATLQYTLETAIQAVYKLEADELDSERLGEGKYLLFWEAAEGGAGVLSQLLEKPEAFRKIADAAFDICHFTQPKDSCIQACYECLLSYRNQFDHALINRHLIKPWLDLLLESSVITQIKGLSRDQQYQKLLEQTDPNSDFERVVLQEIYQRGYKLPDAAQKFIPEANCKPDFVYEKEAIAVFCDGSVHNSPDQRKQDKIERDNLRYETGYTILTLSHSEGWQTELLVLASL